MDFMTPDNNTQLLHDEDGAMPNKSYKVVHVFAKEGAYIYKKKRICELESAEDKAHLIVIKSRVAGLIKKLHLKRNPDIKIGTPLIEVEECTHSTVLGNICCDCGLVLEAEKPCDVKGQSTHMLVSMLHSIPDLKVSQREAERLGMEDINNLLKNRKLTLLVDLDQTLVHTTNDNIPPKLKDVYHFQLVRNGPWFHTRIRPYTTQFLKKMSDYYELHICTFGVREYAHYIAHFLDVDKELFGHRILSRNECLDPMSKTANLSSLFPCGDNLVCIIDDRSDVWNFAPNVVQVLPYHFFQHTGDINAPAELQKKENDEMRGFDFTNIESTINKQLQGKEDIESDLENTDSTKSQSLEYTIESYTKDKNVQSAESTVDQTAESLKDVKDITKDENTDNIEGESAEIVKDKSAEIVKTNINSEDRTKNSDENTLTGEVEETKVCETALDEKSSASSDVPETDKSKLSKSVEGEEEDSDKDDVYSENMMKIDAESGVIEVTDTDDYLLYLEDILLKLHKNFFDQYDASNSEANKPQGLPDLKQIVPRLKKHVLSGVHLVFSGVVPHHIVLENSKAYHIGVSLGATVSKKIVPNKDGVRNVTTHIVAANLHTEKVHQAKRLKNIKIVTPNWLWCCSERWDHVDERLFTLNNISPESILRNPPMHCCVQLSATDKENSAKSATSQAQPQTPSFAEDLNPLAFFSNDETKSMEEEVDIVLSDEEEEEETPLQNNEKESSDSSLSTSDEDDSSSSSGESEPPLPINRKRRRSMEDVQNGAESDDDDELPSVRFRQGGALPSDDSAAESDDDDDDLNAYGDILARELLD